MKEIAKVTFPAENNMMDLDEPFGRVGCVIMASGMGKRFGGNKLMADFHGSPLICPIFHATEGLFVKRVVVTRHEEIRLLAEEQGLDVILHHLPNRNHTVRLGVEAMPQMDRIMFVPSDQPLLRRETLCSLLLASKNDPDSIWRTEFEGIPGSPAIVPQWSFDELLSLPEGKGGNAVMKKYPHRVRTVSVLDKTELRDVDTPEDLEELLEMQKCGD